MRTLLIALLCTFFCAIANQSMYGQATNIVSGTIKNSQTKENLSAVSITIKGSASGTYSDEKGNCELKSEAANLPRRLIVENFF